MKRNKLLERQIEKLLPPELKGSEALQPFLDAVNSSFNAFEKDAELSERAFRITEEEYQEINAQLKEEIAIKEASIARLREAFTEVSEPLPEGKDKELLHIATYVKEQISRRIATEQQLKDQKAFYERILNQIPADIAIVDREHRYLFVNPSAVRDAEVRQWIIGKTDEEYRRFRNRPQAESEVRKQHFEEVIRLRSQQEWEERIVTNDGQVRHHLRILHPVFDSTGAFDMMIIYGFNITERKKIEEQIKVSEARYRSIFDNSQALICTHDLDGVVMEVNQAAIVAFGYNREELTGMHLSDLLPEDKRAAFEASYLETIRREGKAGGIMVALSKSHKRLYILYQNYLVTGEQDKPYVIGFSQDITGMIEAERALKKSEEKYRSIIANMNLGLLEVGTDEEIIYANNSFCEMSGFERDELIGKNAATLLLKGANRTLIKEVGLRRREGKSDAYEMNVKDKRGELKWWLVSGAPVFDDDGNFKGSIGIHLDITAQKELEEDLRKAKADAEYSARAKEIFLANMSHEIRTPMNGILGISNLLGKTELTDKQHLYLDIIRNAANNLLVILNDLLDLSKIESGNVTLEYIAFSLKELVHAAAQILRYRAEEKGLLIRVDVDERVCGVLFGDPYRINQVLMNLLSNAIKFTEQGFVLLGCRVTEDLPGRQDIRFTVQDTGIGMSPEFIDHLFDKFSQEDESITRKFGGTGLGMSISRQLIDMMGGRITVHSEKEKGTSITFGLSFIKGQEPDLVRKESARIDSGILAGRRLLLVEDNEMNRLLARTLLEQYGAAVTEAENGEQAILIFEAGKDTFDLILMDVQMPGKDGLETTRFIRTYLDPDIPILALTANAFKQEQDRCLAAGMTDFIAKPFEEAALIRMVAGLLGEHASVHAGAGGVQPLSREALYDLRQLKALGKGDEGFLVKMVALFIKIIPDTLSRMTGAYGQKDWKQLAALAHRLKPSLHTIGIESVLKDVQLLESLTDPVKNETEAGLALDHLEEVLHLVVADLTKVLAGLEQK